MTTKTKIIEQTVYIASDGTEFDLEKDCVSYEAKHKLYSFEGIPPYLPLQSIPSAAVDLTKWMKDYFCTPEYTFVKVYKVEIKNKTDVDWLITFCESETGERNWTPDDFKIHKKYILVVNNLSTKMYFKQDIYFEEYQKIIEHYQNVINNIEDLFK